MYLKQGEETDSTYQVIFRSYTGAFVYFYVQKTDGVTKMVEHVPSLNIENEAGSFNLFDYLKKDWLKQFKEQAKKRMINALPRIYPTSALL